MTNCMSTRRIGRRDSEDSARAVPVQWKDVQVRADGSWLLAASLSTCRDPSRHILCRLLLLDYLQPLSIVHY